ncbi:PepSY domain-containing protein [Ramlibacter sp. H39-3-26]|uniref:PepSY domain-containing protein n=1 Tax=Curvibacter soli TaxID=3031331 RepID=UPI0031F40344
MSTPAHARDEGDHDRARQAVEAGQILPLRTLLERLEREQPGQVMEVDLEREDGQWLYEIKLLQAGGQLVEFKVDAKSARVLSRKEKTSERQRHRDGAR